jgi:hypothetical protein
MRTLAAALVTLTAATAAADPIDTIGARVGGYGFHDPQAASSRDAWNDCRMNGLGVFARKDAGVVTVEAGADLYTSQPGTAEDRLSGILTVAAGARLFDAHHVRALAQLGTGVELTRFSMAMPNGAVAEDSRALPLGFVGISAEVALGAHTALGGVLRTFVMGRFDANAACQLEVEPDAAAQGQLYLAYRL